MTAAVTVDDVYLVLASSKDGSGGYELTAYEAMPTGSEPPCVSARVPMVPDIALQQALDRHFDDRVHVLQQMGDVLATWLFASNPVGAYLVERVKQHQRLRVWLCANEMLHTRVPFESLEHNRFLPFSGKVVRRLQGPALSSQAGTRAAISLQVADKLRVMLVSANPDATRATAEYRHLPHLEAQCAAFESALAPLKYAEEVFLEVLRNPAPEDMQTALQRYNPHVLVFAGHGYAGWQGRGGLVCVRAGAPVLMRFPELTRTLQELRGPALRLGVFIACESFVAAPGLLAAGVPAVVAMQPLSRGYIRTPRGLESSA